ncbi:AB hydrolase superfamily [Lecanosticta acicola]|uniref:AB hydrolase superfamily n=1 Tax=Lecanosticta acicola TaxID=111012 RepID=A0AAI8Z626_9PEZI|nr:AB hydrolase superfamily [Lecanosticta acicola]
MAITEQDRKRMGTMNPLLAEELKTFPALEMHRDDQHRQRRFEHLTKRRHLYPIPGPILEHVSETNHHVEARDGFKIPVKIYKPVSLPKNGSPVLVALHEGGWAMGDLTDEDLNCRAASRDLGMVCINVDYRLLPEHPWPTPVDDCYDVVQWVAKNASPSNSIFPGDPAKGFIVGGASAGGHLSAVMCQLGRDNGLNPPLTGQYLGFPVLLWHDVVPEKFKSEYRSRMECVDDPIFRSLFADKLPPSPAGKGVDDPIMNPLLHPNLKDLPPCYLQVGGLDPLRDEALIWERVLRENGVPTKIDVYDGYGHMFWTNWPLLERSKDFVKDTLQGFKWLLETGAAHQ